LGVEPSAPLPLDLRLDYRKANLSLVKALEMAFRNNPDVSIKRFALESAEWGIKIYKAKKLPRVDLRGSYGVLGEVNKDSIAGATPGQEHLNQDLDLEKEWFMGVHVGMPVGPNSIEYEQVKHTYGPTVLALHGSEDWRHKMAFNLLDKLSERTDEIGAYATLLQAHSDFKKSKDEATVQVKDSLYNVRKSSIQIDSAVAKVRYQEKQDEISKYLASLQEASIATYVEGLIEQAQNRFSFIQAITDYNTAISSLGVAVGDPYYFDR
ncbi:MAG: TolC family protein, partial [Candidatus Omnitrophica bacterium]|nr:TolC family protein [Candidatus Omnitrophota bacterium]